MNTERVKMSNNVILFPEMENLIREIKELKAKLCELLYERDDIAFVQCKNIETRYMIEIGVHEVALYKIHCKVLRMKKKLSLIQQRVNRKEEIDEQRIDDTLDAEFDEYRKKLEEKMQQLNTAISYNNAEMLSFEDVREIKRIYYKVIKNLHPDLNPDLTQNEMELFFRAVAAYNAGDIETMRLIEKALAGDEDFDTSRDTVRELVEERDSLTESVEKVTKQIEAIKAEFPYNTLPLLENEEKLEEKRTEYKQMIESEQRLYREYKEKIENILRRLL